MNGPQPFSPPMNDASSIGASIKRQIDLAMADLHRKLDESKREMDRSKKEMDAKMSEAMGKLPNSTVPTLGSGPSGPSIPFSSRPFQASSLLTAPPIPADEKKE